MLFYVIAAGAPLSINYRTKPGM